MTDTWNVVHIEGKAVQTRDRMRKRAMGKPMSSYKAGGVLGGGPDVGGTQE